MIDPVLTYYSLRMLYKLYQNSVNSNIQYIYANYISNEILDTLNGKMCGTVKMMHVYVDGDVRIMYRGRDTIVPLKDIGQYA